MSSIALLNVDFDVHEFNAAFSLQNNLVLIESFSTDQLFKQLELNRQIDLVVLGTAVGEPLRISQRIHALNKEIALLILCLPENMPQIKRALQFAPLLGDEITCQVAPDAERAIGLVKEIFERTQHRRRYRTTIATVNKQIQAGSGIQPIATHYLNRILDFAPIGIVHIDQQGLILAWNRKASHILDKVEREALGTPLTTFFPGDPHIIQRLFAEPQRAQQEAASYVVERIRSSGETQFIAVTMVPLVVLGQEPSAIVLLEDSTQRVIAERMRDDLLEREQQARKTAEASKEHFALLATVGVVLSRSLNLDDMLSNMAQVMLSTLADWCIVDLIDENNLIRRVTLLAKDPQKQIILNELKERFPPNWDSPQPSVQALKTGQPVFLPNTSEAIIEAHTFGTAHTQLMKSLQTISCIAVPLKAPHGIIGAVTLVRTRTTGQIYTENDVVLSQEIAYRAALAVDNARLYAETNAQREQLRVTLTSIGDGVVTTDKDGLVTFMNPVAEILTGWQQPEAVGRPLETVFQIINEVTRERVESPVVKVLQTGLIVELANHTLLIRKDGLEIPIADSGAPIFDQANEIRGVVLVFHDVTLQRQARERLANLQKVTSELSKTLTLEEVIDVIVDKGLSFMKAKEGALALLNDDSATLSILSSFKVIPALQQPLQTMPLSENLMLTNAVRTQEAIWIEDIESVVDLYPSSYAIMKHQGIRAIATLPLKMEDRIVGSLSLGFHDIQGFNEETRRYLLSIAEQCAQAIDRAQLTRKAQEGAAMEERHRLARDLHDAVSQTLFATTLLADSVPQLWARNPEKAMERLKELSILNRAAMGEMRGLLLELRPDTILKTDLARLMTQLLEAARGRRQLEINLITEGEAMIFSPDIHLTFYRIAQESINNALKHSQATQLSLHLRTNPGQALLRIQDNGQGFDVQSQAPGMGLGNMQHRAVQIGALFEIASQMGQGTTITLQWSQQM